MPWGPINDDTPTDREVLLWLKAPSGVDEPIGQVIGRFVDSDFFFGWTEKSVAGNINNGLPQDLITHWKDLDHEIPT